jgi:hypothetical protein
VWDDSYLLSRAGARIDEQSLRGVGHHDYELRLRAQLREHLRLVRRRLGKHRVQRHYERLCQLSRERQHVLPVAAAEDPVLVLEQDDIDVESSEHAGGADIVASDGLRDRRKQTAPLRARRLVDDRDEVGALNVCSPQQGGSQVGREGADPARPRRVG